MGALSSGLPMRVAHRAHDALFHRVHSSALIYNTCWEDPRLDRAMLELRPGSRVVMITSAGCNALDYLLDDPAEIHAVDLNPRQNALLHLKMALLQHGDHAELFRVFGHGVRREFSGLLERVAWRMPDFAARYWREKHYYFEPSPFSPSFYYRGASGQVAWVVLRSLLKMNPQVGGLLRDLLDAGSLPEQARLYALLRPALWNAFNSWLVGQPLTMAMLGVPRPQILLIRDQFPGGIAGYIQHKMEQVFTRLPLADNYFWRVYATGRYHPACCPNYLKPEHQDDLKARVGRITTHNSSLSDFLLRHPGSYSHFVLLDHQDWLASHAAPALRHEWDLILANSRPGTRILMRSASQRIDFIPAAAAERLRFFPETAERMHAKDRVGTYGSTLLAEVR